MNMYFSTPVLLWSSIVACIVIAFVVTAVSKMCSLIGDNKNVNICDDVEVSMVMQRKNISLKKHFDKLIEIGRIQLLVARSI